jgi:hypothetical protein
VNLLIQIIDLDFLRLLLKNNVRFLIIGGYALRQYNLPREARDLDIWYDIGYYNPKRLIASLEASPYVNFSELDVDNLYQPFKELKLAGHLSHIELLSSLGNLNFDEAYTARETSSEGLPVISARHLLVAKRFSVNNRQSENDRLKDEGDIKLLEAFLGL